VETILDAVARLRAAGYRLEFSARSNGLLQLGGNDELIEASALSVDEIVRFEGDSDPDDEEILVALTTRGGLHGLYSAAFGPSTPSDDVEVLHALVTRPVVGLPDLDAG